MRILQVANFYHATSGGLRTAIDALAAGYVDQGHEVFLIVPSRRRGVAVVNGTTVISVTGPKLPGSGGYRIVIDQRSVTSVIDRLQPDVIELSDRTTLARIVLAQPRPTPVVLLSHERLDLAVTRLAPRFAQPARFADMWTHRLLARVDATVCASAFAAQELDRFARKPARVVPLGVDLEVFRPWHSGDSTDASPWTPGCHHRAVYVGRLSPEKHAADAIAAIGRLVRSGRLIELLVVGDGPQRGDLEDQAAGLPVRFTGHVGDRQQIAATLRSADVAIVPSPRETFGLAALEAMASGTPVATVADGAVAELVTPGSGVVAAAGGGIGALAGAVAAMFEGDREHQRLVARRRAQEFSWKRAVTAMLEIHRVAVSERLPVGAR